MENIIDGLNLFRISKGAPREPQSYEPGIIILAQGKKRIFIGEREYRYDPLNYLILSVPLPLECETYASKAEPMLGLKISVRPNTVGEILLELDDTEFRSDRIPNAVASSALSDQVLDATERLLRAVASPGDRRFLGPLYMREIVYRVLQNPDADSLRAMAFRHQRFFQIARSLDTIHQSYDRKIDLDSLAREAGMSISSFHSNFKAVTSCSPLQYIKSVKLHKARLIMREEGENASSAAYKVGYESPSQFNREYKRLFGATPGRDNISKNAAQAIVNGNIPERRA